MVKQRHIESAFLSNKLPLCIVLSFCAFLSACTSVSTHPASHKTIAHELLALEYEAMRGSSNSPTASEFDERLARLDSIIEQAVQRIKALNADEKTPDGIKKMFDEVDRVLVENNYNLFINTRNLWDTMSPGIPNSGGFALMTDRMRKHREAHPSAVYYRFDCDTGSMIYLGVFDVLKKPVVMVETPKHNFIRWRISDHEHVNWDVNDAKSYTDDEHRSGEPRTAGPFNKQTEVRLHYLADMPFEEVRAYHTSLTADILKRSGRYKEAVEMFKKAVQGRPYSATPRNNLAWMIATEPALQDRSLQDLALEMAESAVALEPTNNLIDTLAAVHAARGNFDAAIRVEQGGAKNAKRIAVYRAHKKPAELGWRDEPDQ